jgi:protein-disulfide isomerase
LGFHRSRIIGAALLLCTLLTAVVSPLAAQQAAAQTPSPQPPPTNQDIEAIKRQIQALIAAQIAVQKQLDEIKAMLKAGAGAQAQAAAPAPPPAIATVDYVIDIANAAVKGAPTARVAVIEFSDYECPFCARHAVSTLPELAKEYIDTGKIRYVFRNLPLESIHPNAMRAAVAAECAGEQGKYWQLHDRMFANQRALDATSLAGHAKAEGLDVPRFQQCVGSDKYNAKIRADQTESDRVGATSTPSFFIAVLTPGNSQARAVRMIRGAHPYPTFKAAIDSVLATIK